MYIKSYKNYEDMSNATAIFISDFINKKPNAVLSFPAGETPLRALEILDEFNRAGKVDFSRCTFIGLDEWVGLGRYDNGSCKGFIYDKVFKPLAIRESQIHFFDACSLNLNEECERIDKIVREKGGIDLMFVGLGMNGHIGLNEPGVDFHTYSHVVELDSVTKKVGQKYFDSYIALEKGITLGIGHLLEAKTVLLTVNGEKKAGIVKKVVEGEITNQIPGSALQMHANCYLLLDSGAASQIA